MYKSKIRRRVSKLTHKNAKKHKRKLRLFFKLGNVSHSQI